MLQRRLTECSKCVTLRGGEAFPDFLDFFLDVWGLNPDLREESELGWREGQGKNFWSMNTFCRMILSD